MKRGFAIATIAIVVLFAAAATRAVWAGRRALDDGDAALARGDRAEAIASWRRAARWYVPLVGASGDAFDRLARLGTEAEARGDLATARAAWQAVHGAAIAIRGATAPFDDRRLVAEARLGRLMGVQGNPGAGVTPADRIAWHRRVLRGAARPTRGWLVLALVGLATLVAGGGLLVARDRRRDAEILIALGAAAWFTGIVLG